MYASSSADGANVQLYSITELYSITGGANQKWIVKAEKDGMRIISALSSSLVLDIQGGTVQNESSIGLWEMLSKHFPQPVMTPY